MVRIGFFLLFGVVIELREVIAWPSVRIEGLKRDSSRGKYDFDEKIYRHECIEEVFHREVERIRDLLMRCELLELQIALAFIE